MGTDKTETQVSLRVEGTPIEVTKIKVDRFYGSRRSRTKVFFFPEGETVLENFFEGRHSRPHQLFRELLPAVLGVAGVSPQKANWSQKAGCTMCPCSPGFILEGHEVGAIFVTYRVIEQAVGKSLGCYGCGGEFATAEEVDAHEKETGHGS